MKYGEWISTDDKLPNDKEYVLVRYEGGNWGDSDDEEKVNYKVAKFIKGLTREEADAKGEYTSADQLWNNKKPYCWEEFGPGVFFGQDVKYWMPLPEPPPEPVSRTAYKLFGAK